MFCCSTVVRSFILTLCVKLAVLRLLSNPEVLLKNIHNTLINLIKFSVVAVDLLLPLQAN